MAKKRKWTAKQQESMRKHHEKFNFFLIAHCHFKIGFGFFLVQMANEQMTQGEMVCFNIKQLHSLGFTGRR